MTATLPALPKRQPINRLCPNRPLRTQNRRLVWLVWLLWALLPSLATGAPLGKAADATPVFRCAQTYADKPCPDARLLDGIDDRRSDAQRASAAAVAAREAALGSRMTRDRETAAAAATSRAGGAANPTRRPTKTTASAPPTGAANGTPSALRGRRKVVPDADDNDFVAFVPRPPKRASVKQSP